MNTISDQRADGRRGRRLHSAAFKADAVAASMQPGVSMAAVAMSRGINANLLRRWVRETEMRPVPAATMIAAQPQPQPVPPPLPASAPFVALQLPASAAKKDIRVELRCGATTVMVAWPVDAASECAMWIRELLR